MRLGMFLVWACFETGVWILSPLAPHSQRNKMLYFLHGWVTYVYEHTHIETKDGVWYLLQPPQILFS